MILLTSDYRLSHPELSHTIHFCYLKPPTSWSTFNVSPKKSIEFVSAPVWQSDGYPMQSAFVRRAKLVHRHPKEKAKWRLRQRLKYVCLSACLGGCRIQATTGNNKGQGKIFSLQKREKEEERNEERMALLTTSFQNWNSNIYKLTDSYCFMG